MKKFLQISSYFVFGLVFAWVCLQLFFQHQTDDFMASLFSDELSGQSVDVLRVMYPDEAFSLEPTSFNPSNRQRLVNIYEPLVAVDRDLNFVPGLALSWGRLDDVTWEFKLRPGVRFQDGSSFEADDVLVSFERARDFEGSDLKYIFDSIEKVQMIDEMAVRIVTKRPDPLLLQKVSRVLVIPSEFDGQVVGTGPYVLSAWEPGVEMVMERNEDYWSYRKPAVREVDLFVAGDKSERVNRFLAGEVDLLSFVPFDAVNVLQQQGADMAMIPGLEVQFLVFNFQSEYFSQLAARQAVFAAINQDSLVEAVGGFARVVNQFVSNGVFGFNPEIEQDDLDVRALVKEAGLEGATVRLDLPLGLDVLGEHVRTQLKDVGVNVIVSYLGFQELSDSFANGDADIYFLGYKAESGDAAEFFETLAASKGEFNIGGYKNKKIDQLVDAVAENLDPLERLAQLREEMKLVLDDYFGVPLLEYETIFAFNQQIDFEPRIDGFIYFNEIK